MENTVFTKVYTQDHTPIRIYAIFEGNVLQLTILEGANAWRRNITFEHLNTIAVQHKLTLEIYVEKLKECVKNPGPDVLFNLNRNEFLVTRVLVSGLKVKYFTSKLDKVNYVEQVEQLMDKFYGESSDNLQKLEATTKERNEMEQCKNSCELKLKEIIQRKKSDEEEQFGRFILILNEKKLRIQHLTELLEAFTGGRPTRNPLIERKGRKRKLKVEAPSAAKKEIISESEPEEEVNTDEEEITIKNEDEPSTSAQTLDFLLLQDTPSSHLLPKRERREKNDAEVVVVASKTEVREESVKKIEKERAKSPVIDLNTQQLLDML